MEHALNISDSLFEDSIAERRVRFAEFSAVLTQAERQERVAISELRDHGYTILRGLLSRDVVDDVRSRVDALSATGRGLLPPRRADAHADLGNYSALPRLSESETAQGEAHIRTVASMVQVADPMVVAPELLTAALHHRVLRIVGCYLGCWPALTYAKLRKSFANGLPRLDTEHFHVDGNSTKMCKALLFLTDSTADPEAGHAFVVGTHNGVTAGIDPFARFSRDAIARDWGAKNIQACDLRARRCRHRRHHWLAPRRKAGSRGSDDRPVQLRCSPGIWRRRGPASHST